MSPPESELNRLTHAVIGAAIDVHRELGPGYLEAMYEEALCVELAERSIAYERQSPINVTYKGTPIGQGYIDVLVEKRLIVELKAVDKLLPIHRAQVISYLRASGLSLALLINFNVPVLRDGIERIAH
ncbi:MAG: GxxExxY protein [Anaerolineae bacterium]|nr:GxxExxY protein [Anaerolineae bacterium]